LVRVTIPFSTLDMYVSPSVDVTIALSVGSAVPNLSLPRVFGSCNCTGWVAGIPDRVLLDHRADLARTGDLNMDDLSRSGCVIHHDIAIYPTAFFGACVWTTGSCY
jgi:hypothetical protein